MSARWCAPRGFDAVSVATASTASRGDRHTHHRRRRDDSSHRAVANQRTRIGGRLRSSTLEGVSSTQEAGYYDIARRDGIIQVRSYTVTKGLRADKVEPSTEHCCGYAVHQCVCTIDAPAFARTCATHATRSISRISFFDGDGGHAAWGRG